jgi:hypothetical protein
MNDNNITNAILETAFDLYKAGCMHSSELSSFITEIYGEGMKQLKDLPKEEYETLKEMGFLFEFFPGATGSWEEDCNNKEEENE